MPKKTPDIIKMLESLTKKPETQKGSASYTFNRLVKAGLVDEGGKVNEKGTNLLETYKSQVEKYGKDAVEIKIANRPGWENYTYTTSVSERVKKEYIAKQKPEVPKKEKPAPTKETAPEYLPTETTKPSIEGFANELKRDGLITSWRFGEDSGLELGTRKTFLRTMTEVEELKKFGKEFGLKYHSLGEKSPVAYSLGNVRIIPSRSDCKNKRKETAKNEYLRIIMFPGSPEENETNKKFVRRFLKNFVPYKPNQT